MNMKTLLGSNELSRKVSDNEASDESIGVEVIDTIDKVFIESNQDRIWELLSMSYEKVLGITKQVIARITFSLSYVESEGEIIACSLYENRLGGLKATYLGCDQTEKGKAALYAILRRDANDEGDVGYWVEASGEIEHIMAKYNANPIPNIYAEYLLNKQVVLDNDGIHYTRRIGIYQDVCRMIFGFPNKKFYYQVVNEHENYAEFKNVMNNKILK